jgi:hypothetical protein
MHSGKLFIAAAILTLLVSPALASHGNGHPECTNGVDDDADGLADANDPGETFIDSLYLLMTVFAFNRFFSFIIIGSSDVH